MRVAIVTIYDKNPNYGNRLQNYASVQILKKCNLDVDTLITEQQVDIVPLKAKVLLNKIALGHLSKSAYEYIRQIRFDSFNRKYLSPSDALLKGSLKKNDYDFYVLGSDQVWNPKWYFGIKKNAFMLTFADSSQKVCMSPSFGAMSVSDEWKEWFTENLKSFPNLSTREQSGREIIKKLIGRDAVITIDPTLALDSKEWRIITKKPINIDTSKKYILTYFLGGICSETLSIINIYRDKYGFEVYNLLDHNQKNVFSSGPREFLYLIENAQLVLTDSFHACVFSFIFNRPFQVFDRIGTEGEISTRIDSFLNMFKLERKAVGNNVINNVIENDYSDGKKILKEKQNELLDFLKKSMNLT